MTARIDGQASGSRTTTFGLREIATAGTQFRLNGRKIFFAARSNARSSRDRPSPHRRGIWKRIIRIAKDHGLNLFRFHSWCPPEAAFQAADELGFYFRVECASWANTSTALGEGQPIDGWLYGRHRILAAYGNHPSFLLMAYGNEPAGKDKEYLTAWVEHYNRSTRGGLHQRLGLAQIAANQFHVTPDPHPGLGRGLRRASTPGRRRP